MTHRRPARHYYRALVDGKENGVEDSRHADPSRRVRFAELVAALAASVVETWRGGAADDSNEEGDHPSHPASTATIASSTSSKSRTSNEGEDVAGAAGEQQEEKEEPPPIDPGSTMSDPTESLRRATDAAAAARALADLAGHFGARSAPSVRHGALLLVHAAMAQFPASEAVQVTGLQLLRSGAAASSGFAEAAVGLGALSVVLWAMCRHRGVVAVQALGCAALAGLVASHQGRVRRLLVEHRGLEPALKALAAFPTDPTLQEQGARLLEAVSRWGEFRAHVVRAGGMMALALAIAEHPKEEVLQSLASRAMSQLCRPQRKSRYVLRKSRN